MNTTIQQVFKKREDWLKNVLTQNVLNYFVRLKSGMYLTNLFHFNQYIRIILELYTILKVCVVFFKKSDFRINLI